VRDNVLSADGIPIAYEVHGAGMPALVFIHGWSCDRSYWDAQVEPFAQTHQVVAIDLGGHGESGLARKKWTIESFGADAVAVVDKLGLGRMVLVGHSMGTQVALETYRLAPARVRGLVLMCGSYGKVTATFHGSDMLKQVLPSLLDAVERRQGLARALWGRIPAKLAFHIARLSKEVDSLSIREEDFRPYMEHVSAMEPSIFLAMLRHAGEHTAEDLLERIGVPTLVISAERDTFTPNALAEHMAGAIPGAQLFVLRGASHAAPIEQPVAIQLRIDKFLREQVDGEAELEPHKETGS